MRIVGELRRFVESVMAQESELPAEKGRKCVRSAESYAEAVRGRWKLVVVSRHGDGSV